MKACTGCHMSVMISWAAIVSRMTGQLLSHSLYQFKSTNQYIGFLLWESSLTCTKVCKIFPNILPCINNYWTLLVASFNFHKMYFADAMLIETNAYKSCIRLPFSYLQVIQTRSSILIFVFLSIYYYVT